MSPTTLSRIRRRNPRKVSTSFFLISSLYPSSYIFIYFSSRTLAYVGGSASGSSSCFKKGEGATDDLFVQTSWLDFTSDAYELLSSGTYKTQEIKTEIIPIIDSARQSVS